MAENRITKKMVKNHWTYNWWKYLLLVFLCAAAVDVTFTTTAYRPPEEKKIEIYILNSYCDTGAMQAELEPLFFEAHPDQEELTILNINLAGDDIYASMQFSTYAAAQQGDVCLMPLSEVQKLAADGADYAFMDLTPYIESGVIDVQDIDLTAGRMVSSTGEEGIYAIPADSLYGLLAYGNDPADSMLCIMDYNGNEETSAAVLDMLIERYRTPRPEGYGEKTQKDPTALF